MNLFLKIRENREFNSRFLNFENRDFTHGCEFTQNDLLCSLLTCSLTSLLTLF